MGVVALGQEDGSEMAAGCDEAEKVNQGEIWASITSNSEKGVRLENIPGCHCQGAKDKWHDHDNQGEDLVREVGKRLKASLSSPLNQKYGYNLCWNFCWLQYGG